MSIVSWQYLAFCILFLAIYYLIPGKLQKYVILAASYFFFWTTSKWLVVWLLITTAVTYGAGMLMGHIDDSCRKATKNMEKAERKLLRKKAQKKKKNVVAFSILINLGILVFLKYSDVLIELTNSVFHTTIGAAKFLLPLGISYYTLQSVSYLVDVFRGVNEPSGSPAKVALYLSFFPHITEGPFSRFADVGEQLWKPHKLEYNNVKFGLQLMIWGFFKKMIVADRAAQYVNIVLDPSEAYKGVITILGVILYTIQLYAEFSGCIDIMTGISQAMGIVLPPNFRQPFFSRSVQEFWQRWHISLGAWLKEYVFLSVTCSKANVRLTNLVERKCGRYLSGMITSAFSLLFVWVANGLWHGAGIKYLVYGLYYYVIMMFGMAFKPLTEKSITYLKIKTETFGYRAWQVFRTWLLVMTGMLIFRAESLEMAWKQFIDMFSLQNIGHLFNGKIYEIGLTFWGEWIVLLFGIMAIVIVDIFHEKNIHIREKLAEQPLVFRWIVYYVAIFAILIFGVYGIGYDSQAFIYAGF